MQMSLILWLLNMAKSVIDRAHAAGPVNIANAAQAVADAQLQHAAETARHDVVTSLRDNLTKLLP